MYFKEKHMRTQLFESHTLLIKIAYDFEYLSLKIAGVEPVITRVWDPVPHESGIHPARMAFDARNEYKGKCLYNPDRLDLIMDKINNKYARRDGKLTVLHHRAIDYNMTRNMNDPVYHPYHLHFQVSPRPSDYLAGKPENVTI